MNFFFSPQKGGVRNWARVLSLLLWCLPKEEAEFSGDRHTDKETKTLVVAGQDGQERVPGKGLGGRQKAEMGRPWEGVGHQGCEQMEGICFAELNSPAGEVWENLMGMVSS